MLKYLDNIIVKFEDIRNGMEKNRQYWTGQELVNEIQTDIVQLAILNDEIEKLRTDYMEKLAEARKVRDSKKAKVKVLEKKIVGIHAAEPERLKDYFI